VNPFGSQPVLTGVGGSGINYSAPSSSGNMGQQAPNVFQGRTSGRNEIAWLGIPVDPPGTVATRIIRITNVRARAADSTEALIQHSQFLRARCGGYGRPGLDPGRPGAVRSESDALHGHCQHEYRGVASPPVFLSVLAAIPGLFTADASGSGQGAIVNQDGSINGEGNGAAPARSWCCSAPAPARPIRPASTGGSLELRCPC
jgi:hypothetical protein